VTADSSNVEGQYGSFGEGIQPALGFGYLFNNNVGIELNGSYLIGRKFSHEHTEGTITEAHDKWGEGILISPSMIIQVPMKSVTPYARFGGTLGIVKVKEKETESGTGAHTGENLTEHSGRFATGLNGALGVKFKAGKKIDIYGELFASGMNYGPEKRENTQAFDGETIASTVTYEEDFPTNSANTELRPYFPFSNFGLNIGVTLNFGKTVKTTKK